MAAPSLVESGYSRRCGSPPTTVASVSAKSNAPACRSVRTVGSASAWTFRNRSSAPRRFWIASASLGRLRGDVSAVTSSDGLASFDQRPSLSSAFTVEAIAHTRSYRTVAFTVERLPPRIGEPSRRPQTPGGRNDWSGTAARSSVTVRTAGSSAAAMAWRSDFLAKGSFSVWNARYPMRSPGTESAHWARRGGLAGSQMSRDRASSSDSA